MRHSTTIPGRQPKTRLGARLNLRLLRAFAVVLPMAALLASGSASWDSVEQMARGRVERAADMLREHAMRAFEAQNLALLAIELRLRGVPWRAIRQDRDLYQFLAGINAANVNSAGIALIDPALQIVMSTARAFDAAPIDVAGRDYVAAQPAGSPTSAHAFVGQPIRRRGNGRVMIPIVRPTQDRARPDYSDGGAVLAALSPESFQVFYRNILETPDDTITLFRLDGAVLAAVPEPSDPEGAALPRSAGEVLSALRQGPVATVLGPSPIDLVPRLTAFRRLDRQTIGIAYGIPLEALNREWRRRMIGPLAGSLLAMMLLLAATRQAELALRTRAAAAARARVAERQATLGLLAGGLAHDFGNITQSVAAAAQLLQRNPDDPQRVRKVAEHLHRHAARSTALSRRLLSTTRRRAPEDATARSVDVSASLHEICELLDATLLGNIRMRCEVPAGLHSAPGIDRAELETAIINLAANARDAMPQGGEVRVIARRETVPPKLAEAPDLPPGNYLRISVSDHGAGMGPDALARLGEPFFTTKPEGEGTGLGLAMVAAFLRGVGGSLAAESERGQGTTIHLLIPAS